MVDVQCAIETRHAPNAAQFDAWADAVLTRFDATGDVTIRLVGETESRALNARYRGHDKPTNVLSFPMSAPAGVGEALLGDLAICAPLVEREARAEGKAIEAHWAHLVVHGLLHLLGYDHETERQANAMENLEREILFELKFPNPYERAG